MSGVDVLNALPLEELRERLRRCCGSGRWVEKMIAARPFESSAALLQLAEETITELGDEDLLEAFAAAAERTLPGEDEGTRSATVVALQLYRERFGYPFVLGMEDLGGEELLMRVRIRLGLEPAAQLRASRAEQRRLTRARVQRLLDEAAP